MVAPRRRSPPAALALVILGTAALLPAQTVGLDLVHVSPGNVVVVVYSKDFTTCAHLLTPALQITHSQNLFCIQGTNAIATPPLSAFNANFVVGSPVKLCHGNNYNICSQLVTITAGTALSASGWAVSLARGGSQTFALDAGPAHAGQSYLLVGSLSGTRPGIQIGPVHVPLNLDGYTLYTATNPNTFPLSQSLGTLGPNGTAAAAFGLPAGFPGSLAGVVLHHAFVVFGPSGIATASNAIPVTLMP